MTTVSSLLDLISLLDDYGISTDGWIKDANSLFTEIKEEECYLVDKNGVLMRHVDVVRVFCNSKSDTLKLVEEKQVYHKTGKIMNRLHEYVSEKIKFGENPMEAAIRGLQEELGLNTEKLIITKRNNPKKLDSQLSKTYTSLLCVYNYHDFDVSIPDDQYKEEYIENQEDKSTFFIWKKK